MKPLILTEGGKNIGFGHLTRCIALYQAFEEKGIISKLVVNGDNSILNLLKEKNFQIFNWVKKKENFFKMVNNTDIIIIDSYLAEKSLYDKISEITNGRIVMIDDYNRLKYPKGIVVNPSIYGDKLNYPQRDGVVYLLGKDYITLRKEFWNAPEKKISKEVKNILVTFGGMNHSDLIKRIISYLKNKFDFHFYVVDARKNKLTAKEMLNLMLKADICISGSGQTTYELARVGVPTIGICFAENQRLNLESWQKKGFIEYIGWYKDRNLLEKIVGVINKLIPYRERIRRSKVGRNCVDGKGVERILSNFTKDKMYKNNFERITLRLATREDCRDLWIWRNHRDVRKWSFDTKPIEYDKHRTWFERKLREEKTRIYIAENKKGEKVGQIRFEMDKGKLAYINVNLNPEFFGKGLGNKIIKIATEVFMKENSNAKEIIAEVIDENIVSKKAFQKAGYIFSHGVIKKGKKISIFRFRNLK